MRPVPDAAFTDPRLAALYDRLEGTRPDLDHYVVLLGELDVRSVLDVGCGTGTFACMLAAEGLEVVGVDPAEASLAIARSKPGADRVRWLHGDATALPPLVVDAATMTGNVAQVFLTDDDWNSTLRGVAAALRPGGFFIFETREPARRAWEGWTAEQTGSRADVPDVGPVEVWCDLLGVSLPLVTFRWTYRFVSDGEELTSVSTLRFRDRDEITASLGDAGFAVEAVRDAPDRPGLELVVVARVD